MHILQTAWDIQRTATGSTELLSTVDIERDCIQRLEEEMFEISAQAGVAGHYQWGLDAGYHQDNWNPYYDLPEEWNHGDRKGNDEEFQVRNCLLLVLYNF